MQSISAVKLQEWERAHAIRTLSPYVGCTVYGPASGLGQGVVTIIMMLTASYKASVVLMNDLLKVYIYSAQC